MLVFNFYNVQLKIESAIEQSELAFARLQKEFQTFYTLELLAKTDIQIRIFASKKLANLKRPLFKTNTCQAFGWVNRVCVYNENHHIEIKSAAEIHIFANDPELLYEMLHITINSFVGFELEKKGFIRLHAASFTYLEQSSLLLLPSHGGKSSLCFELLTDVDTRIISEETSLVQNPFAIAKLVPWSNYISLRTKPATEHVVYKRLTYPTKYLVEIPAEKISRSSQMQNIFWGSSNSLLWPLHFIFSVSLGLGLSQMREMQIRHDTIFKIIPIVFRRFLFCVLRLKQVKPLKYDYSLKPWTKRFSAHIMSR